MIYDKLVMVIYLREHSCFCSDLLELFRIMHQKKANNFQALTAVMWIPIDRMRIHKT